MPAFFFYGTLMDADIRNAVLGKFTKNETVSPARLPGWRRVGVRGRSYPVIVPAAGAAVDGVSVSFADGAERPVTDLLTAFEGDEYRLVALELAPGNIVSVFAGSRRCHPTGRAWSFSDWQRRHKRAFLAAIGQGRLV